SGERAIEACVLRQHLTGEEYLVSASGDGLRHQLFRAAMPVHLRGVDVGHTEVDAEPQRVDGVALGFGSALDHPGALADHRHRDVGPGEAPRLHEPPSYHEWSRLRTRRPAC